MIHLQKRIIARYTHDFREDAVRQRYLIGRTHLATHSQSGQSLVLVALMAVVLVAFVGLAIDGGNAYAQYRIAQNAADGAAVRGALTAAGTWRSQPAVLRPQPMMEKINQAAEIHGIPDTDGSPGNMVNSNIFAYYTDENGTVFSDCPVSTCIDNDILRDAWGVEVFVAMPIDTYFIGVIGMNTMTVRSRAMGIAHPSPRASNDAKWSLFATDEKSCSGDEGYEVDFQGTNTLSGNVHSNGHFRLAPGATYNWGTGQITFVTGPCQGCTGAPAAVPPISIVFPDFGDYYNFANTYTQAPYTGTRYNSSVTLTSGVLGSNGFPAGAPAPVTFINGNLVITSTSATPILLAGLIVVNGNVVIDAPMVQSVTNTYMGNTSRSYGAGILATGRITVKPTAALYMQAYVDRRPVPYHPLLALKTQVTGLYSNYDADVGGGDACLESDAAIDIDAANYSISAAILAPNGRINVGSDSTTGARQVGGTIIGDTVSVIGRNLIVSYRQEWFPPQPDQIELVE